MNLRNNLNLLILCICFTLYAQAQKIDMLILGSDHLAQIYKSDKPNTDILTAKNQKELEDFTSLILPYKPDIIMVEVLPELQNKIDSLYSLFLQNKLLIEDLPDGRSEVYQIAFRLGKKLNLSRIFCVNAPGATSQSILDNGDNIEIYRKESLELKTFANKKYKALQDGSLSVIDFLTFLNKPEIINKIYHLRYITPSKIINGIFKNPDAMIDTAFVNTKYIGAELTSAFKNRDYKIYSNIVNNISNQKSKKALLIIGIAHIGSLKNIIQSDDDFNIIITKKYLKK